MRMMYAVYGVQDVYGVYDVYMHLNIPCICFIWNDVNGGYRLNAGNDVYYVCGVYGVYHYDVHNVNCVWCRWWNM